MAKIEIEMEKENYIMPVKESGCGWLDIFDNRDGVHFCISNYPEIKKVIFNNPATIIVWDDGSKTVVKLMEGDIWDPEKGFAMAYLKKILGQSRLKKEINEWVKPQEELEKDDGLDLIEGLDFVEAVKDYIAKAFNVKKEDK